MGLPELGVLHGKCFINENAASLEGLFYTGHQGPVEVAKDQNPAIGIFIKGVDALLLKIHLPDLNLEARLEGRRSCPFKRFLGNVTDNHRQPLFCQE